MDREKALIELKYALDFTQVYKSYDNKAIREANCLKLQIPHVLVPIDEKDLIAGMMQHSFVGFSPQYGGIYTYFFHRDRVEEALKLVEEDVDKQFFDKIKDMIDFWEKERTIEKLNKRFEEKFGYRLPSSFHEPGFCNCDGRLAGTNVDLDKLIRLGLPGLLAEVENYKQMAENKSFYEGLKLSIDVIIDACKIYEVQATELSKNAEGIRKAELEDMASTLHNIQYNKPKSFKEGLQLFWIYAVVSDLMNYGRMDVYLGDLYVTDMDSKKITEEIAIRYMEGLYKHFIFINKIHDCRVIIGGKGRRNEDNADRMAMLIMEVSRRVKEVVPQLTLRYYKEMKDEVYTKALQVNAEGCTFPIIYSDETNIPSVMKAYDVPYEEAVRYMPFGCGEYVLEGLSTGTPNNGVNLLKALELVLHNGYDNYYKSQIEMKTGELDEFTTFEDLWTAYDTLIESKTYKLAYHKILNYTVAAEQASYLHISLLMDDCLVKGKALLDGGVRYLNASSEVFGIISAADSLTAIKKYVYEEKRFTLKKLVNMLDENYEGYEKERQLMLAAPKYGNDNDEADEMAKKVFDHIALKTIEAGKKAGLHKYLMVSVNNSMSSEWGVYCIASACGRKSGAPMSNGNGPSLGADKKGITALLNSMSKFDAAKHVGVINNIRFTKEMFNTSFDTIKLLLKTFYENNGVQTNITAVGRDDLEQAVLHPDKYQNLLVRIGGFSARFVELSSVVQNEIILRTTYES